MYRPGMFTSAQSGNPLPEIAVAPPREPQSTDWNAFGRRGAISMSGGAGSEQHSAFGRRQPRDTGRRDDRPRGPFVEFVPSNSLTAYLNHALTTVEPKETEWQTRLRSLQKKRDVPSLIAPVPGKPKPVDLKSETAFPTLGGAPTPKNTWVPKSQSFASLMKKHIEDDAEAARVETERKELEQRACAERAREERRCHGMPSLARICASNVNSYSEDDDEHDTNYNPEDDLDYQYNTVRHEEPETQAEAAEAEDEGDDDSFEHVENGW